MSSRWRCNFGVQSKVWVQIPIPIHCVKAWVTAWIVNTIEGDTWFESAYFVVKSRLSPVSAHQRNMKFAFLTADEKGAREKRGKEGESETNRSGLQDANCHSTGKSSIDCPESMVCDTRVVGYTRIWSPRALGILNVQPYFRVVRLSLRSLPSTAAIRRSTKRGEEPTHKKPVFPSLPLLQRRFRPVIEVNG